MDTLNYVGPTELLTSGFVNTHAHLRDKEERVRALLQYAYDGGAEAILPIPNLTPGLRTVEMLSPYLGMIRRVMEPDKKLTIIGTMMLTEQTTRDDLRRASNAGIVDVKLLPKYRTTNSEDGIRKYWGHIRELVAYCTYFGIRVHVHPEHPWMLISSRDAEYMFLPIAEMLLDTGAVIIWEHGTDARCIPFWEEMAKTERFFVTITAHHLATNEDEVFGDVRGVCKPPIKTERDRGGLVAFVGKNYPWVMAGLDDAPHPKEMKHTEEGRCACGDFTTPFGLRLYAHTLDHLFVTEAGVKTFVNFTGENARNVYGLPLSTRKQRLVRRPFKIQHRYPVGDWNVMSFWAGQTINWDIEEA